MAKYKIYYTPKNGKKEKIDETNSLNDAWYLVREYSIAYHNDGISHNIKE